MKSKKKTLRAEDKDPKSEELVHAKQLYYCTGKLIIKEKDSWMVKY